MKKQQIYLLQFHHLVFYYNCYCYIICFSVLRYIFGYRTIQEYNMLTFIRSKRSIQKFTNYISKDQNHTDDIPISADCNTIFSKVGEVHTPFIFLVTNFVLF